MSTRTVLVRAPELPRFRIRVSLDGVAFVLVFHWNRRAEIWVVDCLDADGNALQHGQGVVVRWPLFRLLDIIINSVQFSW